MLHLLYILAFTVIAFLTINNLIRSLILVIRSLTVEDARQQLDAIYNSSPSATKEQDEEI